jgi:hypothetical protein
VEPSCAIVPHGLLLCNGSHGAQGNHDHDPELMGHRAAGVVGVVEIASVVPELTERRTYGMCGAIHLCATVFLGCRGDRVRDS